jgi:hypothetical protein
MIIVDHAGHQRIQADDELIDEITRAVPLLDEQEESAEFEHVRLVGLINTLDILIEPGASPLSLAVSWT